MTETYTSPHILQTDPLPGVIDLGLGNPDLSLLPLDLLQESAAAFFSSGDQRPLQYGLEQGNEAQLLQNGDGFFPLLLQDIAAAKVSVHIESYIWWKGEICGQIARALADKARQGVLPGNIAADVSPERLSRFFVREEHGYRVRKEIREMVIFAPQNLIMDPPFTKLDILSCRNLLIYLTPELQRKLLPLFHYSLSPGGILFLGSAETISASFRTLDGTAYQFFNYLPTNGSLVFGPGEVSKSFTVPVINDSVQDPSTFGFNVQLSGFSPAASATAPARSLFRAARAMGPQSITRTCREECPPARRTQVATSTPMKANCHWKDSRT